MRWKTANNRRKNKEPKFMEWWRSSNGERARRHMRQMDEFRSSMGKHGRHYWTIPKRHRFYASLYDLEFGVKYLYPVLTPLRDVNPRNSI